MKGSLALPNISTQNKANGTKQFGVGSRTEKLVTEQMPKLGAEFYTLQVHGERVEGLIGLRRGAHSTEKTYNLIPV